jgi:hypothetical protein
MGMGGQRHAPAHVPGAHSTGGWLGLGVGLVGYAHLRPPPGFEPRTVQPIASRYTDYFTPNITIIIVIIIIIIIVSSSSDNFVIGHKGVEALCK